MTTDVFFLGNCQVSRFAQFYGSFTPKAQKSPMLFRSITPHFGEYHEEESIAILETAAVAVVQLVTTDYVFGRDKVLDMRGGKPTIFVPYVYLPGFRRLEKLSSKGVPRIDGEDVLRAEMARLGSGPRGAISFMRGRVPGQNQTRLQASLDEMRRREGLGADVKIADYIADSYRDQMPCYAINHPAPHVLFKMYDQVAKLAGFPPVPATISPYDMGRAALPRGNGGLTPYCVAELGLNYAPDSHWFSAINGICNEVARAWDREHQAA
jgi:hypothetical protein